MKKQVLCLIVAVAVTCALCLPVQATQVQSYTDQANIQYADSVALLTSLNVIAGFPDGSFRPNAAVTRGQMAKIIANLLLGPEQAEALHPGSGAFLDVDLTANQAPHWASKYIYWCYDQGILHGDSAVEGGKMTTFRPDDAVTGVEAAKMLLVALGYRADLEDLVGENWSKNTVELAQSVGIFKDYPTDVSAAVRRDAACLFSSNALHANPVESYQTDVSGATMRVMSAKTLLDTTFPPADPQQTQTVTPNQDGAVPASPAASEPEQPSAQ